MGKLTSLRILYAEDDKECREISENLLVERGFEVLCASNGREAWNIFLRERQAQRNVDLVITDINMPKMSGFDLIKKLRESDFKGNIGIVSGSDVSEDFMRTNEVFYVGLSVSRCLKKYFGLTANTEYYPRK